MLNVHTNLSFEKVNLNAQIYMHNLSCVYPLSFFVLTFFPFVIFLHMDYFLLFMFHVIKICLCYTVLSVPCNLVITCGERANLLALLYVVFSCVFVTFQKGVPGQ